MLIDCLSIVYDHDMGIGNPYAIYIYIYIYIYGSVRLIVQSPKPDYLWSLRRKTNGPPGPTNPQKKINAHSGMKRSKNGMHKVSSCSYN